MQPASSGRLWNCSFSPSCWFQFPKLEVAARSVYRPYTNVSHWVFHVRDKGTAAAINGTSSFIHDSQHETCGLHWPPNLLMEPTKMRSTKWLFILVVQLDVLICFCFLFFPIRETGKIDFICISTLSFWLNVGCGCGGKTGNFQVLQQSSKCRLPCQNSWEKKKTDLLIKFVKTEAFLYFKHLNNP